MRASIVIGARSRSFRFLVRLIERMPVLALPAWRQNRTAPVDGRDMLEFLARAATAPAALSGRSWDIAGPDVMSYGELVERIADAMLVSRPRVGMNVTMTGLASVVAAAIADEDVGLITPLMESLEYDLLPRHEAAPAFGVRLHSFDAAVERALREWETRRGAGGPMSTVSETIELDCPPENVWKLIMDPTRFNEWVTIHRKICDVDDGPVREGFQVEQRMALRGAPFTVHWTLTECDAPSLGVWEGKGPAGSYARVVNRLAPNGNGGTHYEYENTFEAPGGAMGRLASRVLVGGMPKREADKSLKKLKKLLES